MQCISSEVETFQQIVGEQLSGVVFVMDYVQLQFNPPPIISVFTPITVITKDETCRSGDDQFRNRLCEQITKIVKSVHLVNGEALTIQFADGFAISISLKESDYECAEAVVFFGQNQERVVL